MVVLLGIIVTVAIALAKHEAARYPIPAPPRSASVDAALPAVGSPLVTPARRSASTANSDHRQAMRNQRSSR